MTMIGTPQPATDVSLVLSFRNEAAILPDFLERLTTVFSSVPETTAEFIFVDDASDDGSAELLASRIAHDQRIRVIRMTRRFGISACLLAGIAHARGRAIIFMDCDLQDPPELIPELLAQWQQGADIVHAVRRARRGESRLKLLLTRCAYHLIARMAEIPPPVEAGDFKLITRRVADFLLALRESDLYLRGLIPWSGFRQAYVAYDRQPRAAGRTHFPLLASLGPWRTLLAGITSTSLLPLALPFLLSLAALSAAILAELGALLRHSATMLIVAAIALATGVILLALAAVAAYLARIVADQRQRPRYIIAERLNCQPPE